MKWMRVTMSAEPNADRDRELLQEMFFAMWAQHKTRPDAAMFESPAKSDPAVFYFSPGAVEIFGITLATYGAVECEAPTSAEAGISVGRPNADDLLRDFPNSRRSKDV